MFVFVVVDVVGVIRPTFVACVVLEPAQFPLHQGGG